MKKEQNGIVCITMCNIYNLIIVAYDK